MCHRLGDASGDGGDKGWEERRWKKRKWWEWREEEEEEEEEEDLFRCNLLTYT
jgi:hypothetical protein